MATSLWSVLEGEDEREEVDEPSHAERPLAPFLRPPLPPPGLRPTAPVVGPRLPPRGRPQPHRRSSPAVASVRPAANCPSCWTEIAPSAAPSGTPAPDALSPPRRRWWSPPPPFLPPPPRLRSPRSRLSRHFPRFRSANSSSGVRPKDRVGVLVVGYQQGLDEGKGRGGSRLSSIGRTIHASPGRFH